MPRTVLRGPRQRLRSRGTGVARSCEVERARAIVRGDQRECDRFRFAEEGARVFITGRRQSELDREVHLDSINNVSSAQFLLQARKQHYRIMKTQPISFLSGLIVATAVPVILNAASLSWNPSKIAKDNGIVVLAEETAKTANRLAVLDHIGDHVDFRIGLVERLAIGIGPGRIEFAEASAEGEKLWIGQSLAADHDHKPRTPGCLDGVDIAVGKRF